MQEPWLERWTEGRIGWHEPHGNRGLKRFWTARGRRVLVPMCGKSVDLLWIEALGNDVVGVELSPLAVRAFFDENGLDYHCDARTQRFDAIGRKLAVVCGDYFDFADRPFDACYDRGALVALPQDLRARYAEHTSELLAPRAYQLVVTLEYDDRIATGPPFPVDSGELLSYWPDLERVSAREDITNAPPKFLDAGLKSMIEVVWRSAGPRVKAGD